MQPLVEALAGEYQQRHPNSALDITAGGSLVGIQAVQEGQVDIGMASRALKVGEQEAGMQLFTIAYDALVIITHPSNPIKAVSLEELQAIYSGEITNWSALGGPDLAIEVVARELSSGTRGAFDEIVLGNATLKPEATVVATAGEVETNISKHAGAIGYVGFGNLPPTVTVVAIDGVSPTPESILNDSYRLKRPLSLLVGPLSRTQAHDFIAFANSQAGQSLISQGGWVAIKPAQ